MNLIYVHVGKSLPRELIDSLYQVLLVSFGFIFGQFSFFWAFEKKMLRSCGLGFIANWFEKK